MPLPATYNLDLIRQARDLNAKIGSTTRLNLIYVAAHIASDEYSEIHTDADNTCYNLTVLEELGLVVTAPENDEAFVLTPLAQCVLHQILPGKGDWDMDVKI